ncbi:monooxygenase [Fusarium agapanthi]|uniref:Monooxygenase n=1 Tax=Fusarium agapanthi TaxID=1803897 RepID=A0A9P5BHZ9_9HYPO|nr:monooxygenase [Fusarium agapanthi]
MIAADTNVLIIGAGMSGIGFAIQLQKKYKYASFEIYEKGTEVGGTWAVNTYPGCGVDVPSHFYSYSFGLNPHWTRKFTLQPEILAYFKDVSRQKGIDCHIRLQHSVTKAEWHSESSTWLVEILNHRTNKVSQRRANILITAVGALGIPKKCEVPGHGTFEGNIFHSATWDHSFDHANKNVVVLGNGCSATQFVPVIAKTAKSVTQFARQPHWLLERPNPEYSALFRFMMRWVPGAMMLLRAVIYAQLEAEWLMFNTATGKTARRKLSEASRKYIRENAPAEYVDALVPKFEVGCKRRVFDTGYLEALHRPNLHLISDDPVEWIGRRSVFLRSGKELPADAIVLATGFETTKLLAAIEIIGLEGNSVEDHWNKHNDGLPQAYYGTCIAGFPNMFIMMGPNTLTGHLSVTWSTECQINFTLRVIDPVLRSLHPPKLSLWPSKMVEAVQVKQQAEDEENSWIQSKCKSLVWSSGCSNWYVEPKTGKNLLIYPEWQWHFWLRSVFIRWGDFRFVSDLQSGSSSISPLWALLPAFAGLSFILDKSTVSSVWRLLSDKLALSFASG